MGYDIQKINSAGILSIFSTTYFAGGIAIDTLGNLLAVGNGNTNGNSSQVMKLSPNGTSSIFAGNGTSGFFGDGGPAVLASLNNPSGIAIDSIGNVYLADSGNNRVRKVSPSGIITTIAGGGTVVVDGVLATQSAVDYPIGIACDAQGNVYFTGDGRIRRVSADGTISTVAGTGASGFAGDGGPATSATLNAPFGVAVDSAGNIYISDQNNNRIRKVLASPPSISVSNTQVSVQAFSNGAPAQASLTLNSSVIGLGYSIAFSTQSGGDWLGFPSLQGQAPGGLSITFDPTNLQPGIYKGTVTINSPLASPQLLSISVTLQVVPAQAAKIALSSQSLSFALTTSSSPSSTQLTVSNQGSGSLGFSASVTTVTGGGWLQVSQTSEPRLPPPRPA